MIVAGGTGEVAVNAQPSDVFALDISTLLINRYYEYVSNKIIWNSIILNGFIQDSKWHLLLAAYRINLSNKASL